MKYKIDHDLHIHSKISLCSADPEQTNERILEYAKENNLKTICLTDHFWDSDVEGASRWYAPQNYDHIKKSKPLPRDKDVRFLFGCETELNSFMTLGISKEKMDKFDFIIIPTTHFHQRGYTLTEAELSTVQSRAEAWVKRLDTVLNMDLPFYKIGLAHLTSNVIGASKEEFLEVLSIIPKNDMNRLFTKAAKLGVGIELNSFDMKFSLEEADIILRPYKIAKECGCKFYLGSDAHHPEDWDNVIAIFKRAIELLGLEETDKFIIRE